MYDLVWSRPMISVAADLGISDVALKKICDKHRVPTPSRGYWAKKAAGKPTKQVPFHETADPQHEHIVIHGAQQNLAPEVREVLVQERERRKARPKALLPAAPEPVAQLEEIHPLIAATAKALRNAKPDRDDVVRAGGPGRCGIEVGAASAERVITILDGLARALEARGLAIGLPGGHMRIAVGPDELTFSLVERIEKRVHVPTMEELALEERQQKKRERENRLNIWSFDTKRAYPEFDFIRTGELSIQIKDEYVRGLRRNWSDGKRQKLESHVDEIASGMVAYLAGVKASREQQERWRREWDRRQHLASLARAREERETKRREFLKRLVVLSAEAEEVRPFVARLRHDLGNRPPDELTRLLEWTEARLARIEGELAPDGIAASLQERELFPEPDPLLPPETQDED